MGISSTDLPILLGLSPYKSERELADEKRGLAPEPEENRAMRIGLALEAVVRDEYQHETGRRLRRVNRLIRHPTIPWAITSLDFEVVGERRIVEVKTSRAGRWDDGLPQDVESQVRWQMGVASYPVADVAALLHGSELRIYTVEHDQRLFADLVTVAMDFRARLAEGGPFAETAESVKRRYPADAGTEVTADPDTADAVRALLLLRAKRRLIEEDEGRIEAAIKTRMADAAVMTGQGFRIVWKRTKDIERTDWAAVAAEYQPEPEVVARHTRVEPGKRPFYVYAKGEGND